MVKVRGRDLHVERRGAGEPLLLIQGMSGHSGHWGEPILERLARDFEIVAFDHRGTGRSGRVDAPFTLSDLAADAVALLEHLGAGPAHVFGISMGGMVAQELVLDHPDAVRTLTLGCTWPGGERTARTPDAVTRRLAEAMLSRDAARALRTAWEVNVSERFADDPANWEAWQPVLRDRPVAVEVIMLQLQAIQSFDASARLRGVDVPALVMHGTEDELVPFPNGELVAELLPGARLERFEGAGHLFFWEDPDRTAALVREHALGQ